MCKIPIWGKVWQGKKLNSKISPFQMLVIVVKTTSAKSTRHKNCRSSIWDGFCFQPLLCYSRLFNINPGQDRSICLRRQQIPERINMRLLARYVSVWMSKIMNSESRFSGQSLCTVPDRRQQGLDHWSAACMRWHTTNNPQTTRATSCSTTSNIQKSAAFRETRISAFQKVELKAK